MINWYYKELICLIMQNFPQLSGYYSQKSVCKTSHVHKLFVIYVLYSQHYHANIGGKIWKCWEGFNNTILWGLFRGNTLIKDKYKHLLALFWCCRHITLLGQLFKQMPFTSPAVCFAFQMINTCQLYIILRSLSETFTFINVKYVNQTL